MTLLHTFIVIFILIMEQKDRLRDPCGHWSMQCTYTRYPSPQTTPTLKQHHDEAKELRIPNLSFIESESLEKLFLVPETHTANFTCTMA